jgi:hypothetical protein
MSDGLDEWHNSLHRKYLFNEKILLDYGVYKEICGRDKVLNEWVFIQIKDNRITIKSTKLDENLINEQLYKIMDELMN